MRKILILTGAFFVISMNSVFAQISKSIADYSLNGNVVESQIDWYRYDNESKTITKIRETYALFDEAGRQVQDKTFEVLEGRKVENRYSWSTDGSPSEMFNGMEFDGDEKSNLVKFSQVRSGPKWVTYEISTDTAQVYQYVTGSPETPRVLIVFDGKGVKRRIEDHKYYPNSTVPSSINITHVEGDRKLGAEEIVFDENGYRKSYELKGERKETLFRDEHNAVVKSVMEVGNKQYTNSESIYEYDGQDNWTKVYRKRLDQEGEVIEELYGFKKTKIWRKQPTGSLEPDYTFVKKTNPINK
ncbi:hypothetical protein [Roseivirga echinicomitans]|uniref:Uncharacterized protein n=1 Tax=Roseivirga echinicomitans TaxID=296218 RepID=A0A150X9R8_9BACT|nr:hypothetical protein [Roseivirga echinicomitans]KYG75436.1 hypothetical protein AWN68_07780 [Roseivirga echinicomitans]